jgi:RNA polymerase sigma-70 factor (ECF subfamily)
MAEDAELARQAAAGDSRAAGEIYDRYAPLLRAILFDATGSLAETDELLQKVFLRALSGLGQLRRGELLCGWLAGIARREGIEYRRQMARQRRRFAPLTDELAHSDQDPAGDPTSRDMAERVRQAVRDLPERERMAVHIHYLCGEPAEAVRQILGLSPSGFYKLLERARERLRVQLLKTEERR